MTRTMRALLLALSSCCALAQRFSVGAWDITLYLSPSAALQNLTLALASSPANVLLSADADLLSTVRVAATPVRLRECFDLRNETQLAPACGAPTVADARVDASGALVLAGALCGGGEAFTLRLAADARDARALAWAVNVSGGGGAGARRVALAWRLPVAAEVFGLGEQFSFLSAAGRRVPVFVREQGLGRGLEPWTTLVNTFAPGECGGDATTTYSHVPWFVSDAGTGVYVDSRELVVVDLAAAATTGAVRVEVNSSAAAGLLIAGGSPLAAVQAYTALVSGRMAPLPPYLAAGGAVIGLEGGGASVRARLAAFFASFPAAPVVAVWVQDWVGLYDRAIDGHQSLKWSWQWNSDYYANASGFVADLAARGVATWTYVNPYLENCTAALPRGARDLFGEALAGGFTVNTTAGSSSFYNGDTIVIDLTNVGARAFLKGVIKTEMLATGARGFMADFGEALPLSGVVVANASFDAPRAAGLPALHNAWPRLWSELVAEAVAEAAAEGIIPSADNIVFFSRSAEAESPRAARLFWLGDQLTTWDAHDGLRSAVTALVSSSFSGFALSHSDIGGYTSFDARSFGVNVSVARSKELFLRWAEHAAFTLVYRTHPGADPLYDWQFDSDGETAAHFARFAAVHAAWAPYRARLMATAAADGTPVIRAAALAPPAYFAAADGRVDGFALRASDQYFIGDALLVAPILDEGAVERRVLLPAGAWAHLWSGAITTSPAGGQNVTVAAPLGAPPVFYLNGSEAGEALAAAVRGL
jgi:alpha-glucosidase